MKTVRYRLVRVAVCTIAVAMLGVSGCNTVKGVGKDVESAGKAIQGE